MREPLQTIMSTNLPTSPSLPSLPTSPPLLLSLLPKALISPDYKIIIPETSYVHFFNKCCVYIKCQELC